MIDSTKMLNYIYETSDMGCYGILTVLDQAEDEKFRSALQEQLTEYKRLRDVSKQHLHRRGKKAEGVNPMAKVSSRMMSTMKTLTDHSSSKIAEMMIEGNTMGVTKSIQHLNDYPEKDEIRDLAAQLLKTEENNIEQMKQFL